MTPELYMSRCLELAQKAKGMTAPNPMVGAVLVCEGRIIGEGWHRQYGGNHAEVNCLDNVNDSDRHLVPQSTMYVSLEPCAHFGKTPPCAIRLVQEGIKKVVIANTDPYKLVSGRGISILKEAGIEVETGIGSLEGAWVNRRFFCVHQHSRPYIILKWAQTQDGYFAPADRSRFQITNGHSGRLLHRWRTEEGAILVGTTTAINDNPRLTARKWQGPQPLRLFIDRNLAVPTSHHLSDDTVPTWVLNEKRSGQAGNNRFIQINLNDNFLPQLLLHLNEHKILSMIVEGGAALLHSFITAGLWDEARVFTGAVTLGQGISAPVLVNGQHAFATMLGADRLDVFTNRVSGAYVAGCEL
ncbi:MAG: bifunctional diaminohydroxyphosphoribosylaminopyrimidine deaminase/5-amino-6-(5-phosphoribosylamino)uracil reductase RibD [Taibaiella sp.]|nr:bifunctional diaminohydroxyphosphoribosylaminopyrimidine deaminase/5-amino-6-(5-phosphoribosylamino)uracil reductase RibD [Taibaiella sp.]